MRPLFVLTCDEAYVMPLATALRSIVEANRGAWPLEFHILAGAVEEETRGKVSRSLPEDSAVIHWVPVDQTQFSRFLEHGAGAGMPEMGYARLLIPEILPDTVQRVLYLDPDIVVTDDLMPLWETDLHGAVLGAVADSNLSEALKRGLLNTEQVPRVQDYFNSGVLLIDLARWREMQVSQKTLQYIARHPRLLYPDQDALNVVCDKLWWKLDSRWNFQDHLRTRISGMGPEQWPAIVHFVTKVKPWISTMPSLNARFYDSYRSRTCFALTPLERIRDGTRRLWTDTKEALKRHCFVRGFLQMCRQDARGGAPKLDVENV